MAIRRRSQGFFRVCAWWQCFCDVIKRLLFWKKYSLASAALCTINLVLMASHLFPAGAKRTFLEES
ncbi:MAG: hypothetical protein CMN26_08145 [Salinisphaera sp.]|nr:hypothetical protein [Salinisphaera sp.]